MTGGLAPDVRPVRLGKGRVTERTVLVVASFGAFLAFLDATIVNVAFPSIQRSFPTESISSLSWILNAYNIVFAAFLVVSGRLADLVGRRRAFSFGVLLFTIASAVCAVAPSVSFLVGARIFQALGAAILVPASLALIVEAFPAAKRSHAIGLWGASAALAAGLGPPIGGALVEAGGWRWAFIINIPFGLAALWAGRRLLVESRAPGRRRLPDLKGAALSAGMLGLLTLGIVQGNAWGWTSWEVLGCLVGSAALFGLFVRSSRTHRSPLLDPTLLRIRPFAVGNTATIVAGMGFYAYLLTNILWLQYVWGYSVLRAGLALVPAAVVAAVLAAVLGPFAERRGYRLVIIPGAIIWSLSYLWYATRVGVQPDFLGEWLPGQVLSGVGVGATLPLLGSAALAAVPGGRFATASALNSSARQIGAVLGIAILVVIVGTPSSTTAVTSFRHGWVFSAACFVVVAAIAVFLGRIHTGQAEGADDGGAPVMVTGGERTPPWEVNARMPAAVGTAPLFALLNDAARLRLEQVAVSVDLAAGEWLFHQGDAAEDLYLVRSGRLEVLVNGEPVRQLGAGTVVGELSLLIADTRTASVRARRDSHLLRISHAAFEQALSDDAQAMGAVATVLARRLASPRPTGERKTPQPTLVAVVAVDATAPAAEVADALVTQLRNHLKVAAPGEVGPESLERAEADNDRVVLVATTPDDAWWQFCVRQADHLVLVARSSAEPLAVPPLGRTGADLVLIGSRLTSDRVIAWSEALEPWQITFADESEVPTAVRPLAARIAGRSVGVVMAGGGARSFAHIGVLKELAAAGVSVDRVAGTSAGSIIAALHALGHDAETIHAICYEEFVRRRPFSDYTLPTVSLAKGRRVRHAVQRHFADVRIEELPLQLRCASTDLRSRKAYAHRSGLVADAVLASIALPVLFPPRRHQDRLLVDGGILDNLPVGLLTERDEGPLVAVNISMGGAERPPSGPGAASAAPTRPQRVPSLGETLLRTMFIGSGGAVEAARDAGAVVVTPATLGVGLLEFHQLDRMVEAGREAGRAVLDQSGDLLGAH